MLSTVNIVILYIKAFVDASDLEWSLFKYKAFAWMTVILYASLMLCLYFFISFGVRKIAKREGMSKTWLAWIPFAQFIVLLNSSNAEKICWMKKKTFAILLVSLTAGSFLCSVVLNTIQYNTTIKLLFLKKDAWNVDNYILKSENNYMYLVEILTFASSFLLYFLMYDFFRQRTGKYWLMTVLCIFFSGLFPIFVFVYRNAPKADYARRYVYYTNVPPRGNNSSDGHSPLDDFGKTNPKDEPFSEFNTSNGGGKSDPFSEFSDVNQNANSSDSGNESSDDDMFN